MIGCSQSWRVRSHAFGGTYDHAFDRAAPTQHLHHWPLAKRVDEARTGIAGQTPLLSPWPQSSWVGLTIAGATYSSVSRACRIQHHGRARRDRHDWIVAIASRSGGPSSSSAAASGSSIQTPSRAGFGDGSAQRWSVGPVRFCGQLFIVLTASWPFGYKPPTTNRYYMPADAPTNIASRRHRHFSQARMNPTS